MSEKIDMQLGGTFRCDDGREVTVEPHSERIHLTHWSNGVIFEVLLYSERQEDCVDSDRIHLLITADNGERTGWLMNVEDASEIIEGLSRGINYAIQRGYPIKE